MVKVHFQVQKYIFECSIENKIVEIVCQKTLQFESAYFTPPPPHDWFLAYFVLLRALCGSLLIGGSRGLMTMWFYNAYADDILLL